MGRIILKKHYSIQSSNTMSMMDGNANLLAFNIYRAECISIRRRCGQGRLTLLLIYMYIMKRSKSKKLSLLSFQD